MKKLPILLLFALLITSCGGGEAGTDATDEPGTTGPTTTAATTTTTAATTTTEAAVSGDPNFVLSEIKFGSDGYVAITNQGDGAGSLDGWQLCQRPRYFRLSGELGPGETLFVTVGAPGPELAGQVLNASGKFGELDAASGEIGLYRDSSFDSSDSIVSYVEWGESGHGRSSTAAAAGLWPTGDFVDSAGAGLLTATAAVPAGAGDWSTG